MSKLKGVAVSNKMQKTVVVRVDRLKKHPKYLKYYRSSKRFKVHDPEGSIRPGDTVLIQETRPLSKEKRWRLFEIVKRGESKEEDEGRADAPEASREK
jgi:small subunit ribosomal protein S17